jgi:hypothetical protein
MFHTRSFAFTAALVAAMLAPTAQAKIVLEASTPVQGSVVVRPTSLDLTFNEGVSPHDLSIGLVMTAMPGMSNHKPMTIKGFAVDVKERTASLKFPRPLPPGSYRLDWKLGGQTSHKAYGALTFTVR